MNGSGELAAFLISAILHLKNVNVTPKNQSLWITNMSAVKNVKFVCSFGKVAHWMIPVQSARNPCAIGARPGVALRITSTVASDAMHVCQMRRASFVEIAMAFSSMSVLERMWAGA